MSRPCHCDNVQSNNYSLDQCRACWLYHYDISYRRLWGGDEKHLRSPCLHLGTETGTALACPSCNNGTRIKLFDCAKHGQCTLVKKLSGIACCTQCGDYCAPKPPIEWVSTSQLVADTLLLAAKLPADTTGIVGIPRSGMIPASILATSLHVPLWELTDDGQTRRLGGGSRTRVTPHYGRSTNGQRLIVVDDTVYSGNSMAAVRRRLGNSVRYATVYPTPWTTGSVDFYTRTLPSHQLLEWNLFNAGVFYGWCDFFKGGFATDMDGILCNNPTVSDADEEGYRNFLGNATPMYLPRLAPIELLVTARLEKWRAETEEWLNRFGVRWKRLVMHPASSWRERSDVAAWKAGIFASSACDVYVESEPELAEDIFRHAHKPVLCPRAGKIWQ